jgi:hypothetical protein
MLNIIKVKAAVKAQYDTRVLYGYRLFKCRYTADHAVIIITIYSPEEIFQAGPLRYFAHTVFLENYSHTRRLRLETVIICYNISAYCKALYNRIPSGYFKPLLDPGSGFGSEMAVI